MSISRNRTFLLRFIFPSICGALGTWQIFRWQKKKQILEEVGKNIYSEPIKVETVNDDKLLKSSVTKFSIKVNSTGERALLGPRGLGSPLGYGYTLFEKAKLPNGEIVVLNRGNLKISDANESIPKLNEDIIVVPDKEERKPLFARKNSSDRILWKDWNVLREAFSIPSTEKVKFFKVLADKSGVLHGHELSLDQIPNRHLEYIATWFSLASFSFLMSFIKK